MTKLCKLILHQRNQQKQYAAEDIAFSPKDFPNLKVDDIVEIYSPEEDCVRLILKVSKGSLRDDIPQKDAVSIEQSIATTFQLRSFSDVIVNQVDAFTVEIDSVEVTFKDQYMGRSEMWRLKNCLVDTCVYLNKKIEYCSGTIRCQVHEMWSHGEKVASGVITAATKIVFRSSTSMVYLFIQMSSEMWEFDIYGDLYFEKAVNGFLSELFAKWKSNGSNHEVTIVLFSRIFYVSTSLENFPDSMKECLQIDYKGRFYEDYYRVAIQNEKYEDWGNTLIHLRHLFVDYQNHLLNVHKKSNTGCKIPKAIISSAAQGNFLEVLNMSLNVFEKHYMDRSFDRTGQLSVVITPGVGVFEVDRELTNVTMQRIIDNGVGSDLVCVGEQPLHAVPLLKFHNKATFKNNVEDYSMPHWINLSFYSTNKKVGYSTYIPRIKLPTQALQLSHSSPRKGWDWRTPDQYHLSRGKQPGNDNSWPNSVYDFDDHDAKIFKLPSSQSIHRRSLQRKKTQSNDADVPKLFRRQNSEPEIHHPMNTNTADHLSLYNCSFNISSNDKDSTMSMNLTSSPAITIPAKKNIAGTEHLYSSSFGALNIEVKPKAAINKDKWFQDDMWTQCNQRVLSPANSNHSGSPKDKRTVYSRQTEEVRRPCRALINPFDPSHAVIKLTSNRRRWIHIFPRGPTGVLIQQHHQFQAAHPKLEIVHESGDIVAASKAMLNSNNKKPRNSVTRQSSDGNLNNRTLTLLWGATGEQEWTPALTTGVDWKSLTIPACLPITTDYYPDERSLEIDYLVSVYSLLPDDVNADYAQQRAVYRRPLTTKEVFMELVSQRLAQGFQLIIRSVEEKNDKAFSKSPMNTSLIRSTSTMKDDEETVEFFLSIGRIFHLISLKGSTITVTRYRPRHPYPSIKIHYRYRFQAPNNNNYEVSWADFTTEKLENYNWNYLDHYICTRGDKDFDLVETLKFWRFRMHLLPTFQVATKKILDGSERCDVYLPLTAEEISGLINGFLKFIETCINRIRRPNNSSKKGTRGSGGSNQGSNTGFRERVNSNRLGERPRARSGSKGLDRWAGARQEASGSGRVSPAESGIESKNSPFQGLSMESISTDYSNFSSNPEAVDDASKDFKLPPQASHQTIIEAMCSQNTGFSFIKSADLPPWTFVSGDATAWLFGHMDKITEAGAVEKFNEMIKEKLICHASGDSTHIFLNGFYLYYIISTDGGAPEMEALRPHGDLNMFRNEWMEAETSCDRIRNNEVPSPSTESKSQVAFPKFRLPKLDDEPLPTQTKKPTYKDVYVDVDFGRKSDRQEWGHVRYQSKYKPDEAFEVTIQWVQATGGIVTDLVQGWARKAQQCNLQLVPIPSNPFALPYSCKSDSLRGPIFIPLRLDSIIGTRSYCFEDFPEESWEKRLYLFQEAIAMRFGFMKKYRDPHYQMNDHKQGSPQPQHHYIHCSGNMFVLIPTTNPLTQSNDQRSSSIQISAGMQSHQNSPAASSHDDYITRHVCYKSKDSFTEDSRIGFLWSWNYMVSKRWKTSATPGLGDESFMRKVLRDFQEFCANSNNRLKEFWDSSSVIQIE